MAYDPELDLMYIGTGNGTPWRGRLRSPAGGDNLYLSSLVALRPDTGEYVWHYQETPGDNWDYTSTQPMILADLVIEGRPRKVILHAPKNGFFYVIDRTDGAFISATNFVDVNWASGYGADGRPVETAIARSEDPSDAIPGPYGAHNWHPMSFNPDTGLVYLPAQNVPINLHDNKKWQADTHRPGEPHSNLGWNTSVFANVKAPASKPFGRLIAWDPDCAPRSVATGADLAVERRDADERRESRLPGHRGRAFPRLQRDAPASHSGPRTSARASSPRRSPF